MDFTFIAQKLEKLWFNQGLYDLHILKQYNETLSKKLSSSLKRGQTTLQNSSALLSELPIIYTYMCVCIYMLLTFAAYFHSCDLATGSGSPLSFSCHLPEFLFFPTTLRIRVVVSKFRHLSIALRSN